MTKKNKTKEGHIEEIGLLQKRIAEPEAANTRLAEDEQVIEDSREYAESIVETVREPLIVLDTDLKVISANKSFYRTFKVNPDETEGRFIYDLGDRQWDIPKLRHLLEKILPEKFTFEDYEVEHNFPRIGRRIMLLNARRIPMPPAKPRITLLAIEDITERRKAEQVVEKAREYAVSIVETVRESLIVLDTDLKVISANKSFYRTFKVDPEETKGRFIYDLGNRQWDIPKLRHLLEEILPENSHFENYEVEHNFKTIGPKTMLLNAHRLDSVKMILLAIEDITEHNRAKDEARKSEGKFRNIFDNAADGILLIDPEIKKFYIGNNAICRMLGYSPEEIKNLEVMDIHPEKDVPYVADQFERQLIGEIHLSRDLPIKRKDGSVFYADVNVTTIKIDGKTHPMAFFHDTTERRNMEVERERTLEWQEDVVLLQQSLLASTPLDNKLKAITDGVVHIFDADFCRIWLIRPGDLCEKGCIHAEVKEGPHVCRYRDKCLHLIASSGRYTHIDGKNHCRVPFGCYKIGRIASGEEHKFLTNDVVNDPRVYNREWARELGLVSFAGYQIRIPNEETIGVLALFAKHIILPAEDAKLDSISTTTAFVIQQAVAEEEKMRFMDIKTASETSSKFTSMVSHELRSPLGAIKEGINLVLEGLVGNINDEQRDLLDTAKKNTDRLGRLINNVLDLQKIESGKMEFDIQENDINEVALEVNKAMSLLAKEKGLDLVVNAGNSIPRLKFDKDKIVEVLTNLVSNAIKYTEKGNITISTKQEENTVHVIVQDTGRGIKAEDMQKLFQAFGQLDGTKDKKKSGTGLGLAISKEIILAHKGKIWAESKMGKGSSFHFVLPLKMRRKGDWCD
ncbi:MAG: PAS domain S-box protein [Sedimentisphaerales bacterium]